MKMCSFAHPYCDLSGLVKYNFIILVPFCSVFNILFYSLSHEAYNQPLLIKRKKITCHLSWNTCLGASPLLNMCVLCGRKRRGMPCKTTRRLMPCAWSHHLMCPTCPKAARWVWESVHVAVVATGSFSSPAGTEVNKG